MTRKEQIRQKADELGQKYFPNENNIWARPNVEAQFVSRACETIAKWADRTMLEKACEWLQHQDEMIGISFEEDFIERFKKAMKD